MVQESKIIQYIKLAKSVTYKIPSSRRENWTPDEHVFATVNEFLKSDIMCTGAVVILTQYSILWTFFKSYMIYYCDHFGGEDYTKKHKDQFKIQIESS